ncbi:MAG TPA: hypothetical protein VK752_30100 [Bryobacteraceae bacterium]|jgi:hypothetical protein|nr:hypothetical protein [Bryobacteraceae bacterium]
MRARAAVIFLLLTAVRPALAADIELRFDALERIISEQVFTQDGRKYVRGTPATRCQFAYLEKPRIGSENGLLRVSARFSGRTAFDLLGGCIGLGDSFDLTITAAPVVRNGAIGFKDVRVTTTKDSYYIRRVRAALTGSFGKDVKIEVKDQARKILEQQREGASYKAELASFNLTDVRITPDSLVLVIDFKLVVH